MFVYTPTVDAFEGPFGVFVLCCLCLVSLLLGSHIDKTADGRAGCLLFSLTVFGTLHQLVFVSPRILTFAILCFLGCVQDTNGYWSARRHC